MAPASFHLRLRHAQSCIAANWRGPATLLLLLLLRRMGGILPAMSGPHGVGAFVQACALDAPFLRMSLAHVLHPSVVALFSLATILGTCLCARLAIAQVPACRSAMCAIVASCALAHPPTSRFILAVVVAHSVFSSAFQVQLPRPAFACSR